MSLRNLLTIQSISYRFVFWSQLLYKLLYQLWWLIRIDLRSHMYSFNPHWFANHDLSIHPWIQTMAYIIQGHEGHPPLVIAMHCWLSWLLIIRINIRISGHIWSMCIKMPHNNQITTCSSPGLNKRCTSCFLAFFLVTYKTKW